MYLNRKSSATIMLLFILLQWEFATADEKNSRGKRMEEVNRRATIRRAFQDLSIFSSAKTNGPLTVVDIIPGESSGAGIGTARTDEFGKVEIDANSFNKRQFMGRWKLIATADKNGINANEGSFDWLENARTSNTFSRTKDVERLRNLPFTHGGTVLCVFDPEAKEKKPFSDVYLLPAGNEWTKAAQEFITHPEATAKCQKSLQAGRFDELSKPENALVAIIAAREVVNSKKFDEADQERTLLAIWNAQPLAQSALTFLLVRSSETATPVSNVILEQLIERAEQVTELDAIVNGLSASLWMASAEQDSPAYQRAIPHLRAVRERANQLSAQAVIEKIDAFGNLSDAK